MHKKYHCLQNVEFQHDLEARHSLSLNQVLYFMSFPCIYDICELVVGSAVSLFLNQRVVCVFFLFFFLLFFLYDCDSLFLILCNGLCALMQIWHIKIIILLKCDVLG